MGQKPDPWFSLSRGVKRRRPRTNDRGQVQQHRQRALCTAIFAGGLGGRSGDIGEMTRGSRPIGAATGGTHLFDNGLGKGLTHDRRRGRAAAMATDVRSKHLGLWRKAEAGRGGGVVGSSR